MTTPSVPATTSDAIKIPGGNTVSRDRQPTLTVVPPNGLKVIGGSQTPEFNQTLLSAVLATVVNTDPDAASLRVAATTAALAAFKPADEIEGMLAAQAVALHNASMECFRRVIIPGQTPDAASKLRRDGANLARAMTEMLYALDRKRGKGPQVVRVERVVVHEGAQAIVGNVQSGVQGKVEGGGGDDCKRLEEPRTSIIFSLVGGIGFGAPCISLRREDTPRGHLPTTSHAKRAMSDAWRLQYWPADG